MHGVRASLALERSGDVQQALKERNAEASSHLSFVDGGGHGCAVVYAKTEELEVEFVCIPRPLERSKSADGGPLAYRVAHRVKLWAGDSAATGANEVGGNAAPSCVNLEQARLAFG
jgi:alkaline phosphatase D